jgi:ATP synthase assembly factor FMC1, mitochondrial
MPKLYTIVGLNLIFQTLLDRYNPLHDLTAEEHIKATARRVGLNMPIERKEGEESD